MGDYDRNASLGGYIKSTWTRGKQDEADAFRWRGAYNMAKTFQIPTTDLADHLPRRNVQVLLKTNRAYKESDLRGLFAPDEPVADVIRDENVELQGDGLDGLRYFRVNLELDADDDAPAIFAKLDTKVRSTLSKAFNYDDYNDPDLDDYQIVSASSDHFMFPVGPRMAVGDGDFQQRAYHQFRKLGEIDKLTLQPLRLRDFNCVYESLCVIYHLNRFGDIPHKVEAWSRFVHTLFCMEPHDF